MTTPSNPLAGAWGLVPDHALGGMRARRISRRFAEVGVGIAPGRLREIAAGAPCQGNELTDVRFAVTATEIERQERRTKFRHTRRWGVHALIVVGMVLIVLNLLISMAYAVLTMTQHY